MKLPNFCKNSSVLMVILYTEILVFALFLFNGEPYSLERFGYTSIFAQWLSLMTISLLCLTRGWLNSLSRAPQAFMVWGFYSASFWIVELTFRYFSNLYVQPEYSYFNSFFRYIACSIIFFLVLRVIELLSTIERRSNSEANARIAALQARIKPHFLFNSLNTIAELTTSQAKHAEQAITSLAKLFRAALSTDSKQHSLEQELSLCSQYESLERWRLDKRLNVDWHIEVANAEQILVPKLLLQPLLENSITHGVESDGIIRVKIDVRETQSHLSIMISNGIDRERPTTGGNGLAIENTKERLFVMYDDNFKFKIKNNENAFTVYIQIPKTASTL